MENEKAITHKKHDDDNALINKKDVQARRPHIVIIGSGFGGLFAAKKLAKADADITIVAKTTHHLFQPLLYQVATGILPPGEIAPTTREILKKQKNVTVLLSEVKDIDIVNHVVYATDLGKSIALGYDYLIVASGAGSSYFGNDHFAQFAPGMKSIDDALEIRARIFGVLEIAEITTDPKERERLMTYVVVGAGPTGVEMAGQIRELTQKSIQKDFRRINPRDCRIIMLDAADRVLPPFGERLSEKAKEKLESIGVEIMLGAMVTDVDANGLVVTLKDGKTMRIESGCKIWAAGVQASPLGKLIADQSDATVDRAGRMEVEPDCSVVGHPEIFVVGDAMTLNGLPGVAQVAIQSGEFAAQCISAKLAGKRPPEAFQYKDKGSMATISKFGAVVKTKHVEMAGFFAWLGWLVLHLLYIVGFKAQVTTLIHWTIAFIANSRVERTITHQQLNARLAVEELGEEFQPTITGSRCQDEVQKTISVGYSADPET